MRYFKAQNLTKTYIADPIIDNLTFAIQKGQKIALVAKNGGGKSTLIKLMMGTLDPTDGTRAFRKGVKIGYLPQDFLLSPENTVAEEVFQTDHQAAELIKEYEKIFHSETSDQNRLAEVIEALDHHQIWSYQAKVDTILARLQLQNLLEQPIKTLSGGEAKRVVLAKTLIDEPEFLILDEPTNHLDVEMIERLENYLKTEQCTLFLVTHDRYFLEAVCDEIFELERGKMYRYPASYEYFLEQQAIRHQNEAIHTEKMRQLLKRELARVRKSPRARATKQRFREKEFYTLEAKYDAQKDLLASEKLTFDIPLQERRLGTKVLKVKNLSKAFGSKKVFQNFSHDFKIGERVGIVGKNGSGKTTLIKTLLGELEPDSGRVEIGETVVFGYYQQQELDYPPNKRVIDVITEKNDFILLGNGEKLSASKLLERFLFPPSFHYRFAAELSGGEKRRLFLLQVLISNPNVLILDEPTNDLDLLTISVLEDFLSQFTGCLLVISHDRSFLDRIVDHIFVFEGDGEIADFWGSYSEWREKSVQQNKKEKSGGASMGHVEDSSVSTPEFSKELKQEIQTLMNALESLEKEKAEITQLLNNQALAYDEIALLSEHLGEIIKQIEHKEQRRFEIMELTQ